MRILLQRVAWARVTVQGETISSIGPGLLALAGISARDDDVVVDRMAAKVAALRVFGDDSGRMNLNVRQAGGSVLAISQFTLYADSRGGNRPAFVAAARPAAALPLFERFAEKVRAAGLEVGVGRFGADMKVELLNDGPVTVMLDSEELWPTREAR